VLRCFREREKRQKILVEASAQCGVSDVAFDESRMRLREREHVGVNPRA
jgi:hypothetical protein